MTRRRKKLVAVLLLVLLGYGAWWWLTPKRMHVVKHVVVAEGMWWDDIAVIPCSHGYYNKRVFYDWHGNERWRISKAPPAHLLVEPPQDKTTTREEWQHLRDLAGHARDISPSGEYLARAVVDGHRTRLQSFRYGKLVGDLHLPLVVTSNHKSQWLNWIGLQVHDDGSTWVGLSAPIRNTVYVVKGNQIIASGTLPGSIHGLSPDARFCVPGGTDNRYYPIILKGNHVIVSPGIKFYTCPKALFSDGAFIGGSGQVYRKKQKVPGEQVDQIGGNDHYLLDKKLKGVRVYSPATGDYWWIPNTKDIFYSSGNVTADGRYAVVCEESTVKLLEDRLYDTFSRCFPGLASKYFPNRTLHYQMLRKRLTYFIYKRPGKVLAKYSFETTPYSFSPYLHISPDGRAVLLIHYATSSELDSSSYYTLLRW